MFTFLLFFLYFLRKKNFLPLNFFTDFWSEFHFRLYINFSKKVRRKKYQIPKIFRLRLNVSGDQFWKSCFSKNTVLEGSLYRFYQFAPKYFEANLFLTFRLLIRLVDFIIKLKRDYIYEINTFYKKYLYFLYFRIYIHFIGFSKIQKLWKNNEINDTNKK